MSVKRTMDKAISKIKVADGFIDVRAIANNLWRWDEDVANELQNQAIASYKGPHGPENNKEIYVWVVGQSNKELDRIYKLLQSEVERVLKTGYQSIKQRLNKYR